VNCAETIQDGLGHAAYEMFGIKRRFQRCKDWSPRFKESSVRPHKFGYPLENVQFLLLSTDLGRQWLQIDTDLLRIITSTADELSGVPTSLTLNYLAPQKYGFWVIFLLF